MACAIDAIEDITGIHNMRLPHSNSDVIQYDGIIGVANIVDCVEDHSSRWFAGPFGYVLENVRPVPFRSLSGHLGLFNIDTTLEDLLREPPAPKPDTALSMGDLRKARRDVIITCRHCRSSVRKDARMVPMPPETLITEAHKYRRQCDRCLARFSLTIKAAPLAGEASASGSAWPHGLSTHGVQ